MTVVIQQGPEKIIAMQSLNVGVSREENQKIMQAQQQIFQKEYEIRHLQNEMEDIFEGYNGEMVDVNGTMYKTSL